MGRRYDANPKDKVVAMTYARALHGLDQNTQAVAVMQGAAIQNPQDMQVLSPMARRSPTRDGLPRPPIF